MSTQSIVAIQMDPIDSIKIITDTSFALGLEAQKRGFQLFYYLASDLTYNNGDIVASGYYIKFNDDATCHYQYQKAAMLNLTKAEYVLIRQDPPFDMAYITTTYLLELLPQTTLILNNPAGIRNAPEKLMVAHFKNLAPPTLLTKNITLIENFIDEHAIVIIKPLYDFGGNGIFKITKQDANLGSLIELYQHLYKEPFIVQRYIPEVEDGDKRIIIIAGDPVAVFKRVPPPHQARSNVRIGGTPKACVLSDRDKEICNQLKPKFLEMGIHLAGIDVIGDYLTEINVTSPTGMRMMNRMYDLDLAVNFWNGAEALKKQALSI